MSTLGADHKNQTHTPKTVSEDRWSQVRDRIGRIGGGLDQVVKAIESGAQDCEQSETLRRLEALQAKFETAIRHLASFDESGDRDLGRTIRAAKRDFDAVLARYRESRSIAARAEAEEQVH